MECLEPGVGLSRCALTFSQGQTSSAPTPSAVPLLPVALQSPNRELCCVLGQALV